MTASERLKAAITDFFEDEPPGGEEAPEAIIAALPQIVAVVEQAEVLRRHGELMAEQGIVGNPFGGLTLTLAALEEALS